MESAGTYAAMSTFTGRVHQSHAKTAAASTKTAIRTRRTISICAILTAARSAKQGGFRPCEGARKAGGRQSKSRTQACETARVLRSVRPRRTAAKHAATRLKPRPQFLPHAPPDSWKPAEHHPESHLNS